MYTLPALNRVSTGIFGPEVPNFHVIEIQEQSTSKPALCLILPIEDHRVNTQAKITLKPLCRNRSNRDKNQTMNDGGRKNNDYSANHRIESLLKM